MLLKNIKHCKAWECQRCLCSVNSVPKYVQIVIYFLKTNSHPFFKMFSFIHRMHWLAPSVWCSGVFLSLNEKGRVTSFQDPLAKPVGIVTDCGYFFSLHKPISINSFRKGWTALYFCWRWARGSSDQSLMWCYGVKDFKRVMYGVVRPESVLTEVKKAPSLGTCTSQPAPQHPARFPLRFPHSDHLLCLGHIGEGGENKPPPHSVLKTFKSDKKSAALISRARAVLKA